MQQIFLICCVLFATSLAKGDAGKPDFVAQAKADPAAAFDSWASFHQRTYGSDAEKTERFGLWKAALAKIEKHNNDAGATFTMELNNFADRKPEEMAAFLSLELPKAKLAPEPVGSIATVSTTTTTTTTTTPPASLDWRTSGVVTAVKDQGQCGSCWAFGGIASVESVLALAGQPLTQYSEQEILDCNGKYGCSGGTIESVYTTIINRTAIRTTAQDPYTATQGTCPSMLSSTTAMIADYHGMGGQDETKLMAAVAQQPVVVAIAADNDFSYYKSGVLSSPSNATQNHAVTVIGYGTDPTYGDYWLVKNSWGTW